MLEQVYRLRVQAWRARRPDFPDIERWSDEFDAAALHWAIIDNGAPVAAARLTLHDRLDGVPHAEIYADVLPADLPAPIAVLSRLFVMPKYASMGLSRTLDVVRLAYADAHGCRTVIGETFAGTSRLNAVQELGFVVAGQARPYRHGPLAAVKNSALGTDNRLAPTCIIRSAAELL